MSDSSTERDSGALVRELAGTAPDRFELWSGLLRGIRARQVAEVGVYRGAFAERMLAECPAIEAYHLVDPWRHLDDWNKPANRDDDRFRAIYDEAMRRTARHEERRVVLRGRTTDVVDQVADSSLDFVYIDGDHTLRGITVDLVCWYAKVRDGGWIGGDDLSPSIWQHGPEYEPTLVFPLAIHFAEAVGARVYALPYKQFLLEKRAGRQFELVDLTGSYGDLSLLSQVRAFTPPEPPPPPPPPRRGLLRRLRP